MKKIFIGIDFSKEKFDVVIIMAENLEEKAPRVHEQFANDKAGYRKFLKWVKVNSHGVDMSLWLFCGENTGDYSKGLSNFLYGKGCDMWLENAKCIKDSCGIRRLKSDRADAAMIAEYAMRNHDRMTLYEPLSGPLAQLRELFLFRQMNVRKRSGYIVRKGEKGRTLDSSPAKSFMARKCKHMIAELDKTIKECDKMIEALIASDRELQETYEIVTSVPGIGAQNAVCMMVYTDNFKRFDCNPRKIACYYGIAPFGHDSGTSVHCDPHVHYMANKTIKGILTQAALCAINHCPPVAHYYARLIERGKKTMVALNNVKNKLVRIVTALVRTKQKFIPEYEFAKRYAMD